MSSLKLCQSHFVVIGAVWIFLHKKYQKNALNDIILIKPSPRIKDFYYC